MGISHNFLNSVTNNLAVITFDTSRNITYVSDAFCQTVAYSREELLHMRHRDLCFPEFANSPEYEVFWQNLLSGRSFQDQVVRRASDGAKVFLEANYFPLQDDAGKLLGICKICFDKTAQTTSIKNALTDIMNVTETINDMYQSQTQQMEHTKTIMDTMQQSSNDNLKITEALKEDTQQIDEITKSVHEISYHTNILSVNTALQAVRTNENTDGFSVVAKEMRKLSREVDESSSRIQTTLQNIVHKVDSIDQTSSKTGAKISSALSGFARNQDSLHELESSSTTIKENVEILNELFSVQLDNA
ncbi:chemotaxis protein [Ligilactobacillus salitolerans]|uniref:Chemotaxis protein n=1 Tax=Ligilactobacillus salitolerans TaxID=1808352 RepID=A0A401IRD6_9LACO|nr:methyl-accepting chemotaxis protein [Ligilactobacillus salitolerans]GBG94091.1 chemotaxis protein [Ligilactobacillus salitolerans]